MKTHIQPKNHHQTGVSNATALLGSTLKREDLPDKTAGQPLTDTARAFFEPRFGVDLSDVRVRSDETANRAAEQLRADAFTLNRQIFFGSNQYAPDTHSGRSLLAHEISHVAQQESGNTDRIQRRVVVEDPDTPLTCRTPPGTVKDEARDHIELISGNAFTVLDNADVAPRSNTPDFCSRPAPNSPEGVACLHDMHCLPGESWKIKFADDQWPHTVFEERRVYIMSSCSPMQPAEFNTEGNRMDIPGWRVLAHELCGHGWLHERGEHPPPIRIFKNGNPVGRPDHDPTVDIENTIAGEVDPTAKPRGTFRNRDPHLGESFGRVTFSDYKIDSSNLYDNDDPAATQKRQMDITYLGNYLFNRDARADIIGNADRLGPSSYNDILGCTRASRVKQLILASNPGLAPREGDFRVFTRGERDCPVDPNADRTCVPYPSETVPLNEPPAPTLPSGCALAPPQCQQPPLPTPEPPAQADSKCRKVDVFIYGNLEAAKADFQYQGFDDVNIYFIFSPGTILTPADFSSVDSRVEALDGVDSVDRSESGSDSIVTIDLDLPNMSVWTLWFRLSAELSTLPTVRQGELNAMRRILVDLWIEARLRP